ncbi:hypothetical protein QUA86_27620 [Microcoleus sp. F6_B6]
MRLAAAVAALVMLPEKGEREGKREREGEGEGEREREREITQA